MDTDICSSWNRTLLQQVLGRAVEADLRHHLAYAPKLF